jgi:hypothetical protein
VNKLVNTLAEVFVLALILGLIVIVVLNGMAVALSKWTAVVFRVSCTIALVPLMMIGIMCARMQLTRLVAAFEEAIQYDLDGDGVIGQDIRLIPVRGGRLVDDVEERDLKAFIRTICDTSDWTQASWRGKQMPSGKECDNDYLNALKKPLVKAGFIQGRAPRVTGRLVENDADVILESLRID